MEKRQTLTLNQPKTPEPIVTKFERRDYVVDAYHPKNLGSIRPGVFAPHIGEIYTPNVRNSLHFYARKQKASRVFAIVWASVCPSVRLSHS